MRGACNVHLQDIQHLSVHNYHFLYFSSNLQNLVFTLLEYHHKPIADKLIMFTYEKFTSEREVYMDSLRPNTVPLSEVLTQPSPDIDYVIKIRQMLLAEHQIHPFACNKQSIISIKSNNRAEILSQILTHSIMTKREGIKFHPQIPSIKGPTTAKCPAFN